MTFQEIEREINEKKNLDKHINSDSKFVRRLVANQAYGLEILINDPSEEVRAAVAMQGYGLTTLRNDSSDWVRYHALKKLEEHRQKNAGYQVLNRIELGENHFVVGHNPKAPSAYATWQYFTDKDYYYNGHYFTDQETAVVDMFKRAGESLDLKEHSLGLSLLTDKDHVHLSDQGIREAICFGLEMVLDGLDLPEGQEYDMDALLQDNTFMEKAIHYYQNIDHTYENEALADGLQNLLTEFPQHRRMPELSDPAPIKLSPEEVQFYNALLQHPSDKIPDIFGPYGDNYEFSFPLDHGMTATLELAPTCEHSNSMKLSSEPPHLTVTLTDCNRSKLYEDVIQAKDLSVDAKGRPTIIGHTSIPVGEAGKQRITVTLEEDESRRRLGNNFIFRSNTEEEPYNKHNGELCKITRGLTPKECDLLCTGLMWEAEFSNGDLLHVFDYELEQTEKGSRKTPLTKLIYNAEQCQSHTSKPSDLNRENTR